MKLWAYIGEQWSTTESKDVYYVVAVALIVCFLTRRWLSTPKRNLPKGPIGLPLFGYLPFLGKKPHETFDRLKEKYGSVFRLRLGRTEVIILADYPAVQDGLSNSALSYRPPQTFDFLPEGFAGNGTLVPTVSQLDLGLTSVPQQTVLLPDFQEYFRNLGFGGANGEQWTKQRRFAIRTMRDLGLGKTRWARLVEDELSEFLEIISSRKGQPTSISKLLGPSISNSILSLIFGKRYPTETVLESLSRTAAEVSKFFSPCAFWNFFPWICTTLSKLNYGAFNDALRYMENFHTFFLDEIQHNLKTINEEEDTDFITQYQKFLQDSRRKGRAIIQNERTMIGDAQALFIGGSDTIRTSLTWLFLIVAAFPDVQDKAYAELESVLGNQQIPEWEEYAKFPYIRAVMMEAQRWKTVVPLNTLRMAAEDMKILGYDVPKGSFVIANNWGLHNDSRYWKNPEKFVPERFLKDGGKEVNLKLESYVPFSLGKRGCPGETVATMEIFLYFTTVIQSYEIRVPNGGKPNLDGGVGLVYHPFQQDLCFVPRVKS